jgi:predicted HicB family RNase H-like nuclease
MKVTFKSETLNPNSTEMKPMILRGENVGEYSYGLYSKLQKQNMKENHDTLGVFENYICGMIHKHFNINVITANDVKNAKKICQEKYGISLNEWINQELQSRLRE